jgi:exodeoxyribonuclease VII small subunit
MANELGVLNPRRISTLGKKKTAAEQAEASSPTFEESLGKLEQIVQQLEQGQLGLGESLACYEKGVKHLKQCYTILEAAERKIESLAGVDAEGNPITEDFDDAEMSLDEKAEARSRRRSGNSKRPSKSRSGSDDDPDSLGTLF